MKTLKILFNLFCIPALIIHEFSHAIMIFLTFRKVTDIYFQLRKKENGKIMYMTGATISNKPSRNLLSQILVSLSPLMVILTFAIFSFFSITCLIIFNYLLLSFKYSLPSDGDLKRIKNYKKSKESGFNEEVIKKLFYSYK